MVLTGLIAWEPQVSDAFPHFVEGTCPIILWALQSSELRLEAHSYHLVWHWMLPSIFLDRLSSDVSNEACS